MTGATLPSTPCHPVRKPEALELVEPLPLSVYARATFFLREQYAERFGLDDHCEVFLACRSNKMARSGDPAVKADFLKRVLFVLSFGVHYDETTGGQISWCPIATPWSVC